MVSKSKIKNEVKRAFRLPSNAAVMSMMALILVCAAPAFVSLIDDSAQSDYMIAMGSYTEVDKSPGLTWYPETPAEADKTFSFLPASQNDGTNVLILNDLTSKTYLYKIDSGIEIDNSDFKAGVSKIVLNFGSDVSSVRLVPVGNDLTYSAIGFEEIMTTDELGNEVGTNSWVLELDQIMLTILKSNDLNGSIRFNIRDDFDGTLTWTSETYMSTTIPYGEIIVGATGALLILCAILATPWVSTSGFTIKRRR